MMFCGSTLAHFSCLLFLSPPLFPNHLYTINCYRTDRIWNAIFVGSNFLFYPLSFLCSFLTAWLLF
jgi:hypothetical protein